MIMNVYHNDDCVKRKGFFLVIIKKTQQHFSCSTVYFILLIVLVVVMKSKSDLTMCLVYVYCFDKRVFVLWFNIHTRTCIADYQDDCFPQDDYLITIIIKNTFYYIPRIDVSIYSRSLI